MTIPCGSGSVLPLRYRRRPCLRQARSWTSAVSAISPTSVRQMPLSGQMLRGFSDLRGRSATAAQSPRLLPLGLQARRGDLSRRLFALRGGIYSATGSLGLGSSGSMATKRQTVAAGGQLTTSAYWKTLPSDADAVFDREVSLDAADIAPTVT